MRWPGAPLPRRRRLRLPNGRITCVPFRAALGTERTVRCLRGGARGRRRRRGKGTCTRPGRLRAALALTAPASWLSPSPSQSRGPTPLPSLLLRETFRGLRGVSEILSEAAFPVVSPPASNAGPAVVVGERAQRGSRLLVPPAPRRPLPLGVLYEGAAREGSLGSTRVQGGPAGGELGVFSLLLLRVKAHKRGWESARVAPAPSGSRRHCGCDRDARDPGLGRGARQEGHCPLRRGRPREEGPRLRPPRRPSPGSPAPAPLSALPAALLLRNRIGTRSGRTQGSHRDDPVALRGRQREKKMMSKR